MAVELWQQYEYYYYYSVALPIFLCSSFRVALLAPESILSRIGKVLLVLPQSNVDPERLSGMVQKITTKQRSQLDPSTVCGLLSLTLNTSYPCYDNKSLMAATCMIVLLFYSLARIRGPRDRSIAHPKFTFHTCVPKYYYSSTPSRVNSWVGYIV